MAIYDVGSIVTLARAKTHGEGDNALHLRSGICGQIVDRTRMADLNHRYIIDFGPEGQWNCTHNELVNEGDDEIGWDNEQADRRPEDYYPPIGGQVPDPDVVDSDYINAEDDIARRIRELEKGKS